tara:strand:+ start:526 stop:1044 length:519 start_codon:yes stop_codon:yes gene_type:complete
MNLPGAMAVLRGVAVGEHTAALRRTAAQLQAGATVEATEWVALGEALAVVMGRRTAPCVAAHGGPLSPATYDKELLAVTVGVDGSATAASTGAQGELTERLETLLPQVADLYWALVDRAHAVALADDGARRDHGWALRLATEVDELRSMVKDRATTVAPDAPVAPGQPGFIL